jgi:two-component system LytT family response regulator
LIDQPKAAHSPWKASGPLGRIAVKVNGSTQVVRTAEVDWWETEGNYVRAHVGAASHLVRITATKLEGQLDGRLFVRIHRFYIVNLERIAELQRGHSGDASWSCGRALEFGSLAPIATFSNLDSLGRAG